MSRLQPATPWLPGIASAVGKNGSFLDAGFFFTLPARFMNSMNFITPIGVVDATA